MEDLAEAARPWGHLCLTQLLERNRDLQLEWRVALHDADGGALLVIVVKLLLGVGVHC